MSEDIRVILDLKDDQAPPDEGMPKTSGFAKAGLVLIITALISLVVAVPVTLAGGPNTGAAVAALLIIVGFGFGVLALLLSVVALLHIACSRGKRHGYEWVCLTLGLIVVAAVVFSAVARKWGDRFFKIW